jgi:hypothetical protein
MSSARAGLGSNATRFGDVPCGHDAAAHHARHEFGNHFFIAHAVLHTCDGGVLHGSERT